MANRSWIGAGVAAMTAIPGIATPACAQTASTQNEAPQASPTSTVEGEADDIIITARKRDERLSDVPIAASVISAGDIDQRGGLQGVKDLVTTIPSVAYGDTSTPLTSEISIRGSGTSRGTSADSGVGLYRNGAFVGGGAQGGRTYSRFDLFDVSQIEVLRGTQGALYGRDAVGGAVNVITARPTETPGGRISVKSGNNRFGQLEFVVNQPLTDGLSVRLGADILNQSRGFYYNPELGNYIDSQYTYGFRGQLQYKNDNFDANIMLEHATNKYPALNLQLWILPNATYPKGLFIEPRYSRPANFENLDTDRVKAAEFTWHYKFGSATLTSISLWRERTDLQQFDSDLFTPALAAQVAAAGLLAPGATVGEIFGSQQNSGRTKTFNQELYLSGELGSHWKWLVGGEYVNLRDGNTIITSRTPTKANTSTGTRTLNALQL
ncbi:MAG: TonB-dependent receptor plug domain-containing protein, partial [Proteobacteria bacterium]|nr:TonB-dependent receptor plug domain-containing protein [Pseudomonadota bacterium]